MIEIEGRADAVNLARNIAEGGASEVTSRGLVSLARTVLLMDQVLADIQNRGEVVVTKNPEGHIVAVTRQDEEGRILCVIAEADSQKKD